MLMLTVMLMLKKVLCFSSNKTQRTSNQFFRFRSELLIIPVTGVNQYHFYSAIQFALERTGSGFLLNALQRTHAIPCKGIHNTDAIFSCTLAALALVRILYIEEDDHGEDDNDDDNNEIMGPHDL